jgi:hypothetical protein
MIIDDLRFVWWAPTPDPPPACFAVSGRYNGAIIEREGNEYIALCLEVNVASQGDFIDEARDSVSQVLELSWKP